MNKLGLIGLAAQAAPRLFQVRRRTWIMLGIGLLVLFGLFIWAAIALTGWFFGQAQGWGAAAPEAARGALERVERQVEQVVPGAREKLGEIVPALKPEAPPARDVSGTDLAPVARYPGLVRAAWHREGTQVTARYEGQADYAAVLSHYIRGFTALGYAQEVRSATPEAEAHAWTRDKQRYLVKVAAQPKGRVAVEIETTLE
ncbi:MAG: hypothetical protein AB1720_03970 [Pseudomonadota bacterium]|jgi:hypothetical protein